MYISPQSKNSLRNKFLRSKDKEKEKKEEGNTPLSQKIYNQKRNSKLLQSKNLISRNIDYIKINTHKVLIRNRSNIDQSIKLASNENSLIKNDENLLNRTKNLFHYRPDIYTPKNSKNQSSTNIYIKSKNEKNNFNLPQKNIINNGRKTNVFLKNFFNNDSTKDKYDSGKNIRNKIFSFPVSPKDNKNNTGLNSNKHYNLKDNNNMINSFFQAKKPDIGFKNFSSNSSTNIFNSNNESNNDVHLNSYNHIKTSQVKINFISKIQKRQKNKNKSNMNVIDLNNKNFGTYFKNIYYNNSKYINGNDIKGHRNNNNYILINHLLLNDINITGNNADKIMDKVESPKIKPKTSRNEKINNNNKLKEELFFSNNDNIKSDNYINLSESNIKGENDDMKKKIKFYKIKNNGNISPEETHFNTVDYLQKVKISKYNMK